MPRVGKGQLGRLCCRASAGGSAEPFLSRFSPSSPWALPGSRSSAPLRTDTWVSWKPGSCLVLWCQVCRDAARDSSRLVPRGRAASGKPVGPPQVATPGLCSCPRQRLVLQTKPPPGVPALARPSAQRVFPLPPIPATTHLGPSSCPLAGRLWSRVAVVTVPAALDSPGD